MIWIIVCSILFVIQLILVITSLIKMIVGIFEGEGNIVIGGFLGIILAICTSCALYGYLEILIERIN